MQSFIQRGANEDCPEVSCVVGFTPFLFQRPGSNSEWQQRCGKAKAGTLTSEKQNPSNKQIRSHVSSPSVLLPIRRP
jgi:hypothetical protein